MVDIILMEPAVSGNIGAIARVMKNFGFSRLVLVNPKCKHLSQEARNRAKHANDILENARVLKRVGRYDYLIGTTAKLGRDYNMPRCGLSPSELAGKLGQVKKAKVGLLFGRESSGLLNSEIAKCDFVVTIPASKEYYTLNLSHSVAIILYELSKENHTEHIAPISSVEKRVVLKMVDGVLNKLDFSTKEKKETQRTLWKKIIGKAMLTKREAFALLGFLRKIKK